MIFVISFVYLFGDEIEKTVLSKINEELKSDLVVGDIEFSIQVTCIYSISRYFSYVMSLYKLFLVGGSTF